MCILKMKLYNSSKIIKAIRGSESKFEVLKEISQKILEIRKNKKLQEKFVKKAYEIVFKNLSSKKKEVVCNLSNKYSVNITGISKTYDYGINATNITQENFFKSLVEVKKNLSCFLKVLSPIKKTILKKFMEKAQLLEEKKPIKILIGINIEWTYEVGNENDKKYIEHLKVVYNYERDINIHFDNASQVFADKINTINLDFRDYAIIEQLYNQLKKVLKMELKQNVKELENMKKFLIDIDEKFSGYIKSIETLNELKK